MVEILQKQKNYSGNLALFLSELSLNSPVDYLFLHPNFDY